MKCTHPIDGTISSSSEKCPRCGEFKPQTQIINVGGGAVYAATDQSGQPRSAEDLQTARDVVDKIIVRDMLKVPPELGVMLPTIRDALHELINRRMLDR